MGNLQRGAGRQALIGRSQEQAALLQALDRAGRGHGGVLLVVGEAGIGKTRLVESVLSGQRVPVLRAPSRETQLASPYAPLSALLRAQVSRSPASFDHLPFREQLLPLLPELRLHVPHGGSTPAGFLDAVCGAVRCLTDDGPVVLLLEDLQWADHATLDLLPSLAEWLADRPALLIGTYRREEMPRGHRLRHARQALKRADALQEISVDALTPPDAAELIAHTLGQPVSAALAAQLFGRTEGVPLFIEELALALQAGERLASGPDGCLDLIAPGTVELPWTLREAIVLGLDRLPAGARVAAEVAAVLGHAFDANMLLDLLQDDAAFDALSEGGLIAERHGGASFRHALIRDAVYAGIPWARRRTLHRQVAAHLEAARAAPGITAEHWLAGHEPERARAALLAAAETSCRLHAYHDAAEAAGRALELWPTGVDEARRLDVLDQLGQCAQACGLLSEAGRAWREAAQARRDAGDLQGAAAAQHRLAGALELQGLWEGALEARRVAADAFAACEAWAAAAEERLAIGSTLRAAGRNTAALAVLARALDDARRARRADLEARILGQEGNARARSGQVEQGLRVGREGVSLAVAGGHTSATVETLHRLADTLEHAGDYLAARSTYADAFDLCGASGPAAFACRACVTVPLYQNGVWDRAMTECRTVLTSSDAPVVPRAVAGAMLGTLLAHRGQPARARPYLLEARSVAQQLGLAAVHLRALWGLALAADAAGQPQIATERIRDLLDVWDGVEDHYHILFPLRWASSVAAAHPGADAELQRITHVLSRAADLNGGPVAFSALAHALGELAWLGGHPEAASRQFETAVRLLRDTGTPFEEASTRLRAGQVLAALGLRAPATEHLVAAHHTARTLNAARLTQQAAGALDALGEHVARRGTRTLLGSADLGLTRRQVEVLRRLAQGHSDKAIAAELRLSPRTVEMHVSRLLASLDSRSRTEAVVKATELGLLAASVPR
ncbi:ATP-binding protein [Deinococcus ruber]|uniref:HTH luxR-type domain-containing protein n=1 Tax=Deinococcus ruber TaxID=1848197 RepID=A0A918CNG3_9DEIO|nr:AAA family ATPase [Deinococcus ruber]GGR33428.1 hypothetical protein GCM10008957_49640 [Deinococcus ruber]